MGDPAALAMASRRLRLALEHTLKRARFMPCELMAARLANNVVSPVRDVIAVAPATLGLELGDLRLGQKLFTIGSSLCAPEERMDGCKSEPPQSRRD